MGGSGLRSIAAVGFASLLGATAFVAPAGATTPAGANGEIVFSSDASSTWQLEVMGPDATGRATIFDNVFLYEHNPVFSPDGRYVYFAAGPGGGISDDIYRVNRNGTGLVNLTNIVDGFEARQPAVSPDGLRIAFTRPAVGQSDMWAMNADGSGVVNISNTPSTVSESSPDYSPDGRTIVYGRWDSLGGTTGIWVMGADGSNQRPVFERDSITELDPAFSRDGKRIIFEGAVDGEPSEIFAVNLDGTGLVNLTNTPAPTDELSPSVSGDGKEIVFSYGDAFGNEELGAIPAGGGPARNLTNTPGTGNIDEAGPHWHAVQRCGKKAATVVGDDGPDTLRGTKGKDVIVANAGRNLVKGRAGNDVICAGKKGRISCGKGTDRVIGKFKKAKGCERIKRPKKRK